MKITLVYAGIARVGWNSFNKLSPEDNDSITIPSGLLYLKAVLQHSQQCEVELIDLRMMSGYDEYKERLYASGSGAVGISFLTPSRNFGVHAARIAKELGKITIAGGVHASALPHDLASTGVFDCVVAGEGENAILEIIELIKNRLPLPDIFRARNYVQDLDSLPFPSSAFLPTYDKSAFDLNGRMSGIVASRGCPGRCKYCWPNQNIMYGGASIRMRSPANVVEEMRYLYRNFDIRYINFYDDTFTWNKKWLKSLRDCVAARAGKTPPISVNAMARSFDEEVASLLEDMKCTSVWFGFESGSDRILKMLNKGCSVADNVRAARICREHGFDLNVNILVGIPGESEEDYLLTYDFLEAIEPLHVSYNILTPYPGSAFYNELTESGLLDYQEWEDFDVATPHIKGTGVIKNVDYSLVRKWVKPFRAFMAQGILRKNNLALEREVYVLREREKRFALLGLTDDRLRSIEQNSLLWRFSRALINCCYTGSRVLTGACQRRKGPPPL